MKIKITLSITIMIGVAIAVVYQGVDQKLANPVFAQIGSGCSSFIPATYQCGDNPTCGTGEYTSTAAFPNGSGTNGVELRSVACQGTSCGNVENVPMAFLNNYCCDQDFDLVTRTSCGGNDCNDNPDNGGTIYPGRPEICDGIDNNCANGIDEGCPTPTPTPLQPSCLNAIPSGVDSDCPVGYSPDTNGSVLLLPSKWWKSSLS